MAKVFLDYGHGGSDPGASGQGLVEKERNFTIGRRVKYHLERHSVQVIESRSGDTNPTLTERSNKANNNNVDASISIHCNAFNGQAKGVETYTYGTGANEIRLAQKVHNAVINAGLYNSNRGIKQGNLHMVREPKMAAILIEMAFIDNSEDAVLLKNKGEEFAVAIAKGILEYVGVSYKAETTSTNTSTSTGKKTYYRVVCGSYTDRTNAVLQQDKLKKSGYISFIDVYEE